MKRIRFNCLWGSERVVLHNELLSFKGCDIQNSVVGSGDHVLLIVGEVTRYDNSLGLSVLEERLGTLAHIVDTDNLITATGGNHCWVSVPACIVCLKWKTRVSKLACLLCDPGERSTPEHTYQSWRPRSCRDHLKRQRGVSYHRERSWGTKYLACFQWQHLGLFAVLWHPTIWWSYRGILKRKAYPRSGPQ